MLRAFREIIDVLLMRCLRCHRGRVWRGPMMMNVLCPVCGWRFEREIGYFYGAMYASWFFSMATVVPVMIVLLTMRESALVILGITLTQVVVQVPLAFMYGRMIWMYVDNLLDHWPVWEPAEGSQVGAGRGG